MYCVNEVNVYGFDGGQTACENLQLEGIHLWSAGIVYTVIAKETSTM